MQVRDVAQLLISVDITRYFEILRTLGGERLPEQSLDPLFDLYLLRTLRRRMPKHGRAFSHDRWCQQAIAGWQT